MYTALKQLQYNSWANGKMVEILSTVDKGLFDIELKSSFTTVRKTLLHIWDAQVIWYTRLSGNEINGWPSEKYTGDNHALLQELLESSKNLVDLVAANDHAFLERKISYKNMKGIEFSNGVEDVLFHIVNHGTFHRGQLITMLRELGIDKFPSQDLIAYVRQLG